MSEAPELNEDFADMLQCLSEKSASRRGASTCSPRLPA
jgi:hypothetical protein